jgi:hypothetical protein
VRGVSGRAGKRERERCDSVGGQERVRVITRRSYLGADQREDGIASQKRPAEQRVGLAAITCCLSLDTDRRPDALSPWSSKSAICTRASLVANSLPPTSSWARVEEMCRLTLTSYECVQRAEIKSDVEAGTLTPRPAASPPESSHRPIQSLPCRLSWRAVVESSPLPDPQSHDLISRVSKGGAAPYLSVVLTVQLSSITIAPSPPPPRPATASCPWLMCAANLANMPRCGNHALATAGKLRGCSLHPTSHANPAFLDHDKRTPSALAREQYHSKPPCIASNQARANRASTLTVMNASDQVHSGS